MKIIPIQSNQRRLPLLLLSCSLLLALGWMAGCQKDGDEGFVEMAAQSNLSEIEQGKLAQQKATDAEVKAFAQLMVEMHTAAQSELKALGTTKGFTVADRLDEEHQSIQDQLSSKSGLDFEKAYINGQVTGHQKTSAGMQTEIDNGRNADVKAYAGKSKPMVDAHLASALRIKTTRNY